MFGIKKILSRACADVLGQIYLNDMHEQFTNTCKSDLDIELFAQLTCITFN